jgi:hypothetical protein
VSIEALYPVYVQLTASVALNGLGNVRAVLRAVTSPASSVGGGENQQKSTITPSVPYISVPLMDVKSSRNVGGTTLLSDGNQPKGSEVPAAGFERRRAITIDSLRLAGHVLLLKVSSFSSNKQTFQTNCLIKRKEVQKIKVKIYKKDTGDTCERRRTVTMGLFLLCFFSSSYTYICNYVTIGNEYQ